MGGDSKPEVVITPEQQRLTAAQARQADIQTGLLRREAIRLADIRAEEERGRIALQPIATEQARRQALRLQTQAEVTAARREAGLEPLREELERTQIERILAGGAATPEQIALIQQAGQAAFERGLTDIERQETQALEVLREELAPARGLRPTDQPIVERGGRIAAEALRQRGQLAAQRAGFEAQQQLALPLEQARILGQVGTQQQQVREAAAQFQQNLRTQAFQNRLQAQRFLTESGIGLATGVNIPFQAAGGVQQIPGTTGPSGLGIAGRAIGGATTGGLIGSALTGGAAAGLLGGAGGGAAAGAAAGSIVPGIGTLIGAGVGALGAGLLASR